jgi:hypothetical protein
MAASSEEGPLMSTEEFRLQLQAHWQRVERRLSSRSIPASSTGDLLADRYQAWHTAAARTVREVIYPRMQCLQRCFDHAQIEGPDRAHGQVCWARFPCTIRRPARVDLGLRVEHDGQLERLMIVSDLRIAPAFFRFTPSDRLMFRLKRIDQAALVDWVEEKLLDFVETYLRLEYVARCQEPQLATDPVALVRFSKHSAAATATHAERKFYFVSPDTEQQFWQDPARYVVIDD